MGLTGLLKETDEPDELIARTFSTNGVSITVSGFTSFISFSIGNFSSLYMIRSFSFFAGLGVIILWVNQFLIFGPLLSFHAEAVCQNVSDPFTPCLPEPNPKAEEINTIAQIESKNVIL